MSEGGWLRQRNVTDSYSRWWTTDEARHNYYYWWASAMRHNFAKTADVALLRTAVPAYRQFLRYAAGQLPSSNAAFSGEHDCLWNRPGNEGQENSLWDRAAARWFRALCTGRRPRYQSFVMQ